MTKVDLISKPVVHKLTQLKNNMAYSVIAGDYKSFKTATKEHAKLAIKNYELARTIKGPQIKVPLFSKPGLKMMKVWFLNIFRKKSPEEKALKALIKKEKIRQEIKKYTM